MNMLRYVQYFLKNMSTINFGLKYGEYKAFNRDRNLKFLGDLKI